MNLMGIDEIKADKDALNMHHGLWEWLKKYYGCDADGYDPSSLFLTYERTEYVDRVEYNGVLKEDLEIGALGLSMLCAGGYHHGAGSAHLSDTGTGIFFARIYK